MTAVIALNEQNYMQDSASRPQTVEEKALAFFTRAELSDTLQGIWNTIKRLPFSTLLKLVKAVALVAAVVLLTQSVSLTGLFALAGATAGLLFAAISNVLIWLIYIPMYAVRTSDFAYSIFLALGLAWLAGVSPLVALVFSPLMLFGFRLLERSDLAKQTVSELFAAVGERLEPINLGERLRIARTNIASFASSLSS